ncbi:hypothetical protein TVAG_036020 [Trichomonas vaginalis G3]|uniref:Doublecortin domain-containing protein n=1 Tax=Trichomonas vaginalis (strain ATCC PRA-98 / G3) TaxID=412133 RepID=A2DAS4_TRIV3|nr:hypothetical protein TVAGG3_0812500 [Trichomonas vaginalis G3]EAY22577.1 hypothetical protein TVAG_036020 [Trichomonas vaginalis G3]KAI5497310.1 hypothetical protein TVAGG3_0812500 [Trichomonas vaginalis G3]|eukprot:XP_001583563.1 hypothetical protein [Trichomonas vaginalis G3]
MQSKIPLSPRRLKAVQASPSKIPTKKSNGIKVTLVRNSNPKMFIKNYEFTTINKVFSDSILLLQLTDNPTILYSEYGTKITSNEEVIRKSKIYVSCGEEFFKTIPPPKPVSPKISLSKEVNVQEEEEKQEEFSPFADFLRERAEKLTAEASVIASKEAEARAKSKPTKEEKRLPDDLKIMPYLIVLSSLPFENRYNIPESELLIKQLQSHQLKLLNEHLLYEKIRNSITNKSVNEKLISVAISSTKEMQFKDIQIVFTGKHFSGKTSMLKEAAMNVYRKVQLSNTPDSILFVPLNCNNPDFSNPASIFIWIANSVLYSMEYCVIPMMPYYEEFKDIIYGILDSPTIPTISQEMESIPNLNASLLNKTLKHLYSSYHHRDGLLDFLTETIKLPISIAKAFNLNPLLVIDSISQTQVELSKISKFPDYLKTVKVDEIFRDSLQNISYIIANEDDFSLPAIDIQTSDLIQTDEKTIKIVFRDIFNQQITYEHIISDIFKFSSTECHGCPGYLNTFLNLVDMINKYETARAESSKSEYLSMIDKSRELPIRTLLTNLLYLLNEDDTFTNLLTKLSETNKIRFELL